MQFLYKQEKYILLMIADQMDETYAKATKVT